MGDINIGSVQQTGDGNTITGNTIVNKGGDDAPTWDDAIAATPDECRDAMERLRDLTATTDDQASTDEPFVLIDALAEAAPNALRLAGAALKAMAPPLGYVAEVALKQIAERVEKA